MDFAPAASTTRDRRGRRPGVPRLRRHDYWSALRPGAPLPVGRSTTRWPTGGWIGIAIPEQYGGGGQGITEAAIVLDRVAASGAGMNGSSALHLTMFGLQPGREVRQRAAEGDVPARARPRATCTSPSASPSPTPAPTRAASRRGPSPTAGGYVVRGRKIWTSKALEAEVVLLLVRTDADARSGGKPTPTASTPVPRRPRPPLRRHPAHPEAGPQRRRACEVSYDDLPVEGWRMVGERGPRLPPPPRTGSTPSASCSPPMACGIGEAALRRAVRVRRASARCSAGRSARTRRSATRWPRPTCSCRRRAR